ncbi:MAG: hypothetical protein AMXMBFR36_37570 [Acidobacteriota bacterium]
MDLPIAPDLTAPDVGASDRRPAQSEAERAMRTCPVCGHELAERKCKLYCPRPGCGYFLSCADFY